MSSGDRDIVDRLFSVGYNVISRGNEAVSDVAGKVVDKVRQVQGKDVKKLESLQLDSKSPGVWKSLGGVVSWSYGQRQRALVGASITAGAIVLFWQCKQLLKVPERLPSSQSRCVLIFGDMRDPIVRTQVMDLYRRGFTVFICSTNAKAFRERQEDDDFLRHIDPGSASDLASFVRFLAKSGEGEPCKLASILFMPNLAYYPPGDMSTSQLASEIRSNVLVYYSTLVEILPHLESSTVQLILFNPSLSLNLAVPHHPAELFISGLMSSINQTMKRYHRLKVSMVHVGALKLGAQPSNYKYLNLRGSNINDSLLKPVYNLIMSYNGNRMQRLWLWITTGGSLQRNLYCGRFSYLSKIPILTSIIKNDFWTSFKGLLKYKDLSK